MILYLHGFRSAPASFKARLLAERMAATGQQAAWLCPQLPASPRAAINLARDLIRGCGVDIERELCIIGSSLGGFYATALAEEFGCRAALLNPAVRAARDLASQVGTTTFYHSDQPFEFLPEYVGELEALQVEEITRPERYFLLAATGDEVLDWQEMLAHYPRARNRIINGSDHGISDFAQYMDEVLAFAGHASAQLGQQLDKQQ
ncbi:MAG: alpha/beta fold hydrolase [Burkholderiales bacterium]|nr:alpha/beta fold hydrolase [Burkholderiales bacterium]